jgi:hypothetical protein
MTAPARTCSVFIPAVLVTARLVLAQAAPAQAPAATAPAEWTVEQQKAFLKEAKTGKAKETTKGVTRPSRVTLTRDGVSHDAAFQAIDQRKAVESLATRTEFNFRDYWGYNIAAHELACLIDRCDLVPASIERTVGGKRGSLVWWVDDVRLDEDERARQRLAAPNPPAFLRQIQLMYLFTELTGDTDRNATNILIVGDEWKVVLIDFSRAFRQHKDLKQPALLTRVEPDVLAALRRLTREDLKAKTGRWLIGEEIAAVLGRRDAIVAHLDAEIATRGEAQVVYPPRQP